MATLRILTSRASVWSFGVPLAARLAGGDRLATAVAVSRATFEDRGAGAVVLARSDAYPDALAGGPLAVARNAPLLLTPSAQLDPAVAAELRRVLAPGATVFLLGGERALSGDVARAVADLGYRAERIAGNDRFETAVAVARTVTADPAAVLVTTGADFPDALAASAAASVARGVVVLTDGRTMPAATADYLSGYRLVPRFAVGGPAAAADPAATPIVGADRYETAARVAARFFPGAAVVGVATGTGFPDALAAGARLGRLGAPLLLVQSDGVPGAVDAALRDATRAELFGGTAVVSTTTEQEIRRRLAG